MEKRKILIMTASIGAGHIKAAEAIREALRERLPGHEVRMLDFMDPRISRLNWLLKRLYLRMLDLVPNLYDLFYHVAGGASGGRAARQLAAAVMYRAMARLLERHAPDTLVCTHPFPEGAAALWKRIHHRPLRLVAVLTDYSLHPIWIYPQVDEFFAATEPMGQGLRRMGFSPGAVHACGIPVLPVIGNMPGKDVVRKALGIPGKAQVILLMGGGLGLGGIEATLEELEELEEPLTVLAVAGRNQDLELRMAERAASSRHVLRVWGYTREVHALMRAADILVTKPGALTMSEAFVLGLPMLLHEPIPGPETENAIYAERQGAAIWIHHGTSLAQVLRGLLREPSRLRRMAERSMACGRPRAAQEIAGRIAAFSVP